VSASVNLPLHHKVQKFSCGTGSPGWSWKKGRKTVVVERVFEHRIREQTEIDDMQFGFMKGKGTIDAIIVVKTDAAEIY